MSYELAPRHLPRLPRIATLDQADSRHKQNNAIREYFATDAILETPATTVKGIKDIKELADLHAAFYKDDRVDVSKVDWDDE